LRRFARSDTGAEWHPEGTAVPIVIGRTGLAWGVGFDELAAAEAGTSGPRKREGDGRSPAGIFEVESAFGFPPADSMGWVRLPYLGLTPTSDCVDDTASAHYNSVIDRSDVARVDWQSAEHMRQIPQYRLGAIIGYNTSPAVRGRGSCIFFHIWSGPGSTTAGCTALDERNLTELVGWLDTRARPVVVQLPASVYLRLSGDWGLPALSR
jgi:D-alanyl-D-alanine dipeptidase